MKVRSSEENLASFSEPEEGEGVAKVEKTGRDNLLSISRIQGSSLARTWTKLNKSMNYINSGTGEKTRFTIDTVTYFLSFLPVFQVSSRFHSEK